MGGSREASTKRSREDTLGQRIAKARNALGLTQPEFAVRLGMQPGQFTTISSWETDRSKPRLATLRRIAEVTRRPITYFLGLPENCGLAEDEQELLSLYRAIQDPVLRDMALEAARNSLKADERFREEGDE